MTKRILFVAAIAAGLVAARCAGEPTPGTSHDAGTDGTGPVVPDMDGDGISDEDEGRYTTLGGVDSDMDGIPDYLDSDSDDDGIPDAIEAGDYDGTTPAVDSDADGTCDYLDSDSDGNGLLDEDEGMLDADGDTTPDFADEDNDGDLIDDTIEIGGDATSPMDYDSDGVPDYMDLDSDGDSIKDMHERPQEMDTDGDLIPDRHDLDTDGDTILDEVEAGDSNPHSSPFDTDMDGTPDFRDVDADNDGLSDAWEFTNGLDPFEADTDLDGIPDLIEVGAGTDPMDASSNPSTEGNFYFMVPYQEDPDPVEDTLVFSTEIQMADVFFLMDTTGSMGGAINNLKTSLSSTIIPQVDAIIPDAWFGVARFDDYPVSPYGSSGDVVFGLLQRMTDDVVLAQNGVNMLSTHSGADWAESQLPALWATATGGSLGSYLPAQTACAPTEFGYPCFRSGSVPIVVLITDAPFHNGPGATPYDPYTATVSPTPPSYDDVIAALTSVHAKVISIVSGAGAEAVLHCTAVTTATGAVDVGGSPLLYTTSYDGTGLGLEVVNGIETMAYQVPIDVSSAARDDETDLVDALSFIDRIVPNPVGGVADPADPSIVCVTGLPTRDVDGDTIMDEFTGVLPGTAVCFDIIPARNETVEPTADPQVYLAFIDVIGDGITVLSTRKVYFLIPPKIEGPGVPG